MSVVKQLGIKVASEKAQALHDWLLKKGLLLPGFKPLRKKTQVVFPLVASLSSRQKTFFSKHFPKARLVNAMFIRHAKGGSLKDALAGVFSKAELAQLVSGYDTLGNIAIIEIPVALEKKERLIAQAVLETNRSIETVCKKMGAHTGKFRIEPVKIIAGKKNLVAHYKEFGCLFRIQVGKTFFSPRLSHERQRICFQIRPNEIVGAFFAGVGPFPIIFAKNSALQKAIAIELNPVAVKDLKFNIQQNKVSEKVIPVLGDVKKIVPKKFRGFFDRIVMPLPKGAADFLKEALVGLKPSGGIIHFYAFAPTANPFEEVESHIRKVAAQNGFTVKILFHKQVRTFSKDLIQIVVDFWAQKKK